MAMLAIFFKMPLFWAHKLIILLSWDKDLTNLFSWENKRLFPLIISTVYQRFGVPCQHRLCVDSYRNWFKLKISDQGVLINTSDYTLIKVLWRLNWSRTPKQNTLNRGKIQTVFINNIYKRMCKNVCRLSESRGDELCLHTKNNDEARHTTGTAQKTKWCLKWCLCIDLRCSKPTMFLFLCCLLTVIFTVYSTYILFYNN